MQRNMNRSIPAGEAMDIAKQVLLAILMLILLSMLIPVRAEEAVSPMIVSETANSTEYPALEADIPVITSEGKSNVKIAGVKSKNKLVRYTIPETLLRADENFLALMVEAESTSAIRMYTAAASRPPGLTAPASCAGYSANRGSMIPGGWVQRGCIRSARMSAETRRAPAIWYSSRKRWAQT